MYLELECLSFTDLEMLHNKNYIAHINCNNILFTKTLSYVLISICIIFLTDVTVSIRVKQSAMCKILHPLYCACMHEGNRPEIDASNMSRLYQQAAETLILSGR